MNTPPLLAVPPTESNLALVKNVHPPDWVNPDPAGRYNLVVIGAGTTGLGLSAIGRTIHPGRGGAKTCRRLQPHAARAVRAKGPRNLVAVAENLGKGD